MFTVTKSLIWRIFKQAVAWMLPGKKIEQILQRNDVHTKNQQMKVISPSVGMLAIDI